MNDPETEMDIREQQIDSGAVRGMADLEKTIIVAARAIIYTLYKTKH